MRLQKKQWVLLLIFLSSLFLLARNVFFREAYSGDEGYHATIAVNMVNSVGIIRPDPIPGGKNSEKEWRASFFEGFPPFDYMLLALGLECFGGRLAGMELVPFLAFLLTLVFVYKLMEVWDKIAASFATVLLAVSPTIISLFGVLECEPVLTMFGFGGLYFFVAAEMQRSWWRYLCGGIFLGLSFLTKLWLAAPFVMAVVAVFLLRRTLLTVFGPKDFWFTGLAVIGFVLTASLHLVAVVLVSPQDLSLWLSQCYLGIFGTTAFNKFVTEGTPPNWIHPIWYYPAILYRDHFFYYL